MIIEVAFWDSGRTTFSLSIWCKKYRSFLACLVSSCRFRSWSSRPFPNFKQINYIKTGIDVLNYVVDIWFMLSYKFEHFLKLLIKRPVSETLNSPNLYFIQSQTLGTMDCMIGIKTLLANKTSRLLTFFIYTEIKNFLAFMTLDETLWSHTPFRPENLLEKFLSFCDNRGGLCIILFGKFFNFGQWEGWVCTLLHDQILLTYSM